MPALTYNFILEKEAHWQRYLDLEPGEDSDISSFTAKMQIRPSATSETVLLELSTANGRLTCQYGRIVVNVDKADTAAINTSGLTITGKIEELAPPGSKQRTYEAEGKIAYYDIFLTAPSGVRTRYLQGKVCIVDNVTKFN